MAALRGAGLSGPVELAALVDEEETGTGIRAYVESVTRSFLGCITAEPTDLQTVVGARGASYLRVEIHGTACHAGNPGDGANAIYGAAAVVAEIERMHARTGAAAAPAAGAGDLERRADPWRHRRLASCPPNAWWSPTVDCCPASRRPPCWTTCATRVAGLRLADRGLTVDVTMPMEMPAFETPCRLAAGRDRRRRIGRCGRARPAARWLDCCL